MTDTRSHRQHGGLYRSGNSSYIAGTTSVCDWIYDLNIQFKHIDHHERYEQANTFVDGNLGINDIVGQCRWCSSTSIAAILQQTRSHQHVLYRVTANRGVAITGSATTST